jgi:hypothetical protein
MPNFWDWLYLYFGSAAIGGLIGGGLTWLGVKKSIRANKDHYWAQVDTDVDAFCHAIATEIDILSQRNQSQWEPQITLTPKDTLIAPFYIADKNYFVIFDSNGHLVGKIKDYSLASEIVRVYVTMKGHLDTHTVYSKLYQEYEAERTKPSSFKIESDRLVYLRALVVEQSNRIRSQYREMHDMIEDLLPRLRSYRNGKFVTPASVKHSQVLRPQ